MEEFHIEISFLPPHPTLCLLSVCWHWGLLLKALAHHHQHVCRMEAE
jgi:hypothetical protein